MKYSKLYVMHVILDKFPTHIEKTNNKIKEDKFIKINNQAIYNSGLSRFSRNTVMKNLSSYIIRTLKPQFKPSETKTLEFPLNITISICTVINHGSISRRNGNIMWKYPSEDYVPNWDIDNLGVIWGKAILDALVKLKIIPDDNVNYVKSVTYGFIPVEDIEDRQILIEFS